VSVSVDDKHGDDITMTGLPAQLSASACHQGDRKGKTPKGFLICAKMEDSITPDLRKHIRGITLGCHQQIPKSKIVYLDKHNFNTLRWV
jgi:hypothetical protein